MEKRNLGLFLGLALFVRLALMPLTAHNDIFFINFFPWVFSYHGIWDAYGYFGDHFLKSAEGYTYYPPLTYFILAFFQLVFKPFAEGFDLAMVNTFNIIYFFKTVQSQDYWLGLNRFSFSFFVKLPYLMIDCLCIFLVSKLSKKAILAWLFSPVLLYTAYVMGQSRIISAAVILVILYFLKEKNTRLASFMFGLLILTETVSLVLLPLALLSFSDNRRQAVQNIIWMAVLPLAVLVPMAIHSHGYVLAAYFYPTVLNKASQSIINSGASVVGPACKAVLVVGYLLIIERLWRSRLDTYHRFIYGSVSALLLLYATSVTSIHYFMWILPFMILIQNENKKTWLIVTILLFVFNLDSRQQNIGLLMPINPDWAMSVPSLHEVMDRWLPWGKVVAVSRLLFSGFCLVLAYKYFKKLTAPGRSTPNSLILE